MMRLCSHIIGYFTGSNRLRRGVFMVECQPTCFVCMKFCSGDCQIMAVISLCSAIIECVTRPNRLQQANAMHGGPITTTMGLRGVFARHFRKSKLATIVMICLSQEMRGGESPQGGDSTPGRKFPLGANVLFPRGQCLPGGKESWTTESHGPGFAPTVPPKIIIAPIGAR